MQNEAARLKTLRDYEVLDTEQEAAFDRITQLAATLFDVPIALVSLVDEDRQWFKSRVGLDKAQTSRDISFCGHALADDQPLVVPDAQQDVRFHDNPLVTGAPNVRFYAGAPLVAPSGHRLGTLCLLDRRPRQLTAQQQQVLTDLSALVINQLELRRTRKLLERETFELQTIMQQFSEAIVVVADFKVVFANAAADRLFGYRAGELTGMGQEVLVHPDELTAARTNVQVHSHVGAAPTSFRRRIRTRNGETRLVEATMGRLGWGGADAVVATMRDVTDEVAQSARVSQELRLMTTAMDVLPEGVSLFDANFRCAYANQSLGEMLDVNPERLQGWTPEDVLQHVTTLVAQPEELAANPAAWRAVSQGTENALVVTLQRPRARVLRRSLHRLPSPQHPWMAVWHDITHDTRQLKEQQREALTDALTQLPNRRAVEQAMARSLEPHEKRSVVLFDVDHFKKVNDVHGHQVGDEVLVAVAKVIAKAARGHDVAARWGGEEFIAILAADSAGAARFAERVRQEVAALTTAAGSITISAGVAQVGAGIDVVAQADRKLYEAKSGGRNRVCS